MKYFTRIGLAALAIIGLISLSINPAQREADASIGDVWSEDGQITCNESEGRTVCAEQFTFPAMYFTVQPERK